MSALPQFFGTSTSAYTQADRATFGSPSWWRAPTVVDPVGAALTAAGALAAHVSERTRYAARTVLLLLATQRAPEVTIEDTGEISLEWYRDNQHVAVLTVDGQYIRWAAMLDHIPVAGSEFFSSVIPLQALLAVKAADPII